MAEYFESRGARPLLESENPAEYLLEVIGAGVGAAPSTIDWVNAWQQSQQRADLHKELERLEQEAQQKTIPSDNSREFATSQLYQTLEITKRLTLVWWRNPQYK